MVDWRTELRALAALERADPFPLVLYAVNAPTQTPWPAELASPSAAVREFYQLCDGGYLGGHHRWLSVGELLAENRHWWDLLAGGGPLDSARHVLVAYDVSGFPIVWDSHTDRLATYFYRDEGDLESPGRTLDHFMSELFSTTYPDDVWQEALRLCRTPADAAPRPSP